MEAGAREAPQAPGASAWSLLYETSENQVSLGRAGTGRRTPAPLSSLPRPQLLAAAKVR